MTALGKDKHVKEEFLLVQDLLKQYNLSVSQLAAKAGLADSTVYEYTGGRKKHIPIAVWRALFTLTEDLRILDLIVADVDCVLVPLPKTALGAGPETLKQLIEKRKKDIECETAILDILSDGTVDEKDWEAIEHYRVAHPEALKLSAQIYYTIMNAYEQALEKKNRPSPPPTA